jgi:hypothetical protein
MKADYDSEILRFQKWRRARNFLLWGYLPGLLLGSHLIQPWVSGYSLIVCFVLWTSTFCYVSWRVSFWPCPQCGKPVMVKDKFHNHFTSKCLHCGLNLKNR